MGKKKGELHSIDGARERKQKFEEVVTARLNDLDERIVKLETVGRDLIRASNSASILLAAIERFMDEKFGKEWDAGLRKQVEEKADLARRIKTAYVRGARKDLTPAQLIEVGDEILEAALKLEDLKNNVSMVMHMYTRAHVLTKSGPEKDGSKERIAKVVGIVTEQKIDVGPELSKLMEQFMRHVAPEAGAPA